MKAFAGELSQRLQPPVSPLAVSIVTARRPFSRLPEAREKEPDVTKCILCIHTAPPYAARRQPYRFQANRAAKTPSTARTRPGRRAVPPSRGLASVSISRETTGI